MSAVQSAKVVLLGDAGTGKTSLLRAIRRFPPDPAQRATLAADVVRVPVAGQHLERQESEDPVARQFVFWDTPGQGLEIDYRHALMNCHAALVIVRGEYFRGFESADVYGEWLRGSCPLASRVLVVLQSDRGQPRFGSAQLAEVAGQRGFADVLSVRLDNRAELEGLLGSLETHINWDDVATLSWKLHGISGQLLQILNRNGAVSATCIDELVMSLEVDGQESRQVVNGLCDAGTIVAVGDNEPDTLFMTFERWSRELERLDAMARASTEPDGRFSPDLMLSGSDSAAGPRVGAAVISQLVSAGHYAWVGSALVRCRASRLSQPVRCFISHASSDMETAEAIARLLRSQSLDVWLDAREVKPGDSIVSRIEDGLDSSIAVLALLSPDSLRSNWVQEELRMAVYRKVVDKRFRVIPVVIEQCEVPGFLRGLARVDWQQDGERGVLQIAAQLREAALER